MGICKALFSFIFAISVSVFFCEAKQRPLRTFTLGEKFNGFTYIGQSRKISSGETNASLYFASDYKITWQRARETCIDVLGYDASLISLETMEEAVEVQELIRSGSNTLQSYWTAGQFEERGRKQFAWPGGKLIELDDPLWAAGEPSQTLNTSKLAMVKEKSSPGNFRLRSLDHEENHVFICELVYGSSEVPVPCFSSNDLVLAVDSSGSIPFNEWSNITKFAVNVANAWTSWEETRLSYIVFSKKVNLVIPLNNNLGQREIANRIKDSPYLASGTASHLALEKAFVELEENHRTVVTPRTVVFLTDGVSNSPTLTIERAKKLHETSVRCFSVGVGAAINETELKAIATRPENVFKSDDFASLKNVLQPLTSLACP